MTNTTMTFDDSRAWRNVYVLVLAQGFLGAQMPMLFISAGLAGQSLAGNICFATLPISLIVLGSMLSATPMSMIMQRFGRRIGFFLGAAGGTAGASIAALGLFNQSFTLLLVGSFFTGIYMSAHGFYRFAASDTASDAFRPKAISYVMAGGLLAAVFGAQLAKLTGQSMAVPFLGTYIAVIIINVLGSLLFLFLDIPTPTAPTANSQKGRSRWQMLKSPRITVAIICAMVSYALMNLVMTSTPLAVVGHGHSHGNAADVVMVHVLAMYAPSFFTGHLITRFGVEKILGLGLVILSLAGIAGLAGVSLGNFFVALALLGIGWNFSFIGATTMLADAHSENERGRVQGMNDMVVFGMVTVASLASGGLMNCSGGNPLTGWISVNYAMAPFLILAAGSLIWLVRQPKAAHIA